MRYEFEEMRRTLVRGWGDLGARTADAWYSLNERCFQGLLQPLPIFFVPTSPYGKNVGWTCCTRETCVTHIALCRPRQGGHLIADRGVLLHEMIHQRLSERGLYSKHAGQPWRDEIVRIHKLLTGEDLIVRRQKVIKVKQPDGTRKSVRVMDDADCAPGVALTQAEIGAWPHSCVAPMGAL